MVLTVLCSLGWPGPYEFKLELRVFRSLPVCFDSFSDQWRKLSASAVHKRQMTIHVMQFAERKKWLERKKEKE